VASWEGETTTTGAKMRMDIGFYAKRLSVTVPISLQNLLQSSADLKCTPSKKLMWRSKTRSINGTGTLQPLGILNATGVNVVATATDGSIPTWDMIVDSRNKCFVE
jgi:HK97 family phage major capsid protein